MATLLASFVAIITVFGGVVWALAHLDVPPLRILLRSKGSWDGDWLEAFLVLNGAAIASLLAAGYAYRRYNRALGPLLDTKDDPPRDS
jgi:hypothetical protein